MQKALITILILLISNIALADEATELRNKGVQAAENGDFLVAQNHLCQSAKLGLYTAQVECAFLLESSPEKLQNKIESYAWYQVVISRNGVDTRFAEEGVLRLNAHLSEEAVEHANALAAFYVELYGK